MRESCEGEKGVCEGEGVCVSNKRLSLHCVARHATRTCLCRRTGLSPSAYSIKSSTSSSSSLISSSSGAASKKSSARIRGPPVCRCVQLGRSVSGRGRGVCVCVLLLRLSLSRCFAAYLPPQPPPHHPLHPPPPHHHHPHQRGPPPGLSAASPSPPTTGTAPAAPLEPPQRQCQPRRRLAISS